MVWLERKGSAYIQDRPGPNRARIKGVRLGGLLHSLADVIKLLFKEDITPTHVNKPFYYAAPLISLFIACVTFVVLPFADPITLKDGSVFVFQPAQIDSGILYVLAMTSLGVYGIMLAGWSSNNKFALLGGLRSSAQMISYELSMGLAILAVIMLSGTLRVDGIVSAQSSEFWQWNFIRQPLACLIFIVAAFAETNRAPFDLPESESELVAGYHVEYSSMKFAMFFMAEYANMIIASALIVLLFFGGWHLPFLPVETLRQNAGHILYYGTLVFAFFSFVAGAVLVSRFKKAKYGDSRDFEVLVLGIPALITGLLLAALFFKSEPFVLKPEVASWVIAGLQILVLLGKILFMCWVFVWVRWTLPRFRYDQLMSLGWKYMLPLALVNVLLTAVGMFYFYR